MNKRKKWLIAAGSGLLIIAIIVYAIWREMRDTAVLACVASIHQSFLSLKDTELNLATDIGPDWKVLSGSECDRLMLTASRSASFDCMNEQADGFPLDPWNKHFQCAVRRPAGGSKLEFMVWSNGGDGLPGTSDDLVSPWRAKVPKP